MMTRTRFHILRRLSAAAAGGAALLAVTAAAANCHGCRTYEPGMLAAIARVFTAQNYQGDYMVNQGPVFAGPAVIAPQHTYSPTPTASGYPYVSAQSGQYEPEPAIENEPARPRIYRPAPARRDVQRVKPARRVAKPARTVITVKNDLPPTKGKPRIIRAQAEVRIYGPERMDIRLFRN